MKRRKGERRERESREGKWKSIEGWGKGETVGVKRRKGERREERGRVEKVSGRDRRKGERKEDREEKNGGE